MSEVHLINSWINAPKIKNFINPNIKIDVLKLKDEDGYILTVFEDNMNPDLDNNVLYRVPVECSLANTWSLSTDEAIDLLNSIGFLCEWSEEEFNISETTYNQLNSLLSLGWSNILRTIRPAEIYVINSEDNKTAMVSSLVPNYKYSDWSFLSVNQIIAIESLIKVPEAPAEEDSETESE